MAKSERPKIDVVELARSVIANDVVDCFLGRQGKKSVQPSGLVSCIGGKFFGTPAEKWPVNIQGDPLIPWLQIVCSEIKGLHGVLFKTKAICFFIDPEFVGPFAISKINDHDFVVREYTAADELVPLSRPRNLTGHPFHQVSWNKEADYPNVSKYQPLFSDEVYKELCNPVVLEFNNRSGIKIGGWPTHLQGPFRYPGNCNLQIDITQNYMYGDSGIAFLSKFGPGHWSVEFECC